MSLFSKRESVIQNIAYMGIMAAINVVAVVFMTYVLPILFIPFIFIMPLTSAVVTLFCKKRYFPLYFIATAGICLLTTLGDFSNTLFYVIPSLISGFIFGILIEYKISPSITIFATSLVTTGITYASIPLIELIYGQNMVIVISTLFGLKDFIYLGYIVPTYILTISIIQNAISYAIIYLELPKIGIRIDDRDDTLIHCVTGLFGSIMSLSFCFFYPAFSYFFTFFAMFFGIYEIAKHITKINIPVIVISGVGLLATIILFICVYSYITVPLSLLLFNIPFDVILLVSLVNFCLTKTSKNVE